MKKTVISILLVFLILSMAACGNTGPISGSSEESSLKHDGSMVKETDLTAIDSSNVPIAVIAGFREDGAAFGIGVQRSDVPLQWATDNSAGYATNFTGIACTQDSEDAGLNPDFLCGRHFG